MSHRRSWSAALAALTLTIPAWTAAEDPATAPVPAPPVAEAAPAPAPPAEVPFREFKLYVQNWAWEPDTIRVPVGTKVTLYIQSFDASRTFELRDFGVKVPLPQGKEVQAQFVANKTGTFAWRCSRPCGDGCAKLRGTLIVH